MYYSIIGPLFLFLFFLMLLSVLYIGVKFSKWTAEKNLEKAPGLQVIESAVFALMGLLMAFTFAAAAAKFDNRRHLIIEEANAIGTAYLRLDLVAPAARDALRDEFKQYLSARLSIYQMLPDIEAAKSELIRAQTIGGKIWDSAIISCKASDQPAACILLLPALNSMLDIANTRQAQAGIHPPLIIALLLIGVALLSSLLAGYNIGNQRKSSYLYVISFAAVLATTIYIIIDMEYPRLGLIRVDAFDQVLVDVQNNMK